MYPYPVLFGLTLYELMIVLGFFLAVLTFRIHADLRKYPARFQNMTILSGAGGICLGYYAAVLVQAVYNYLDSGVWELNQSTGATFLGGLLGGAITFFIFYFGGGAILYKGKEKLHLKLFSKVCDIAVTCIVIAHACGRLGCLFAGCCHGAVVDGSHTIPIPLYEALFLLLLYAVMTVGLVKRKPYQLVVYFTGYGVWRFIIEYFRADDRGQTVVSFLSPSQLTSLVMILIALVVFVCQNDKIRKKFTKKARVLSQNTVENGENSVENGDNSPSASPEKPEEDT